MSIPRVTVVHAPACHFCADAQVALAELGTEFPIRVDLVEAASERGAGLVREHRPAMYPLVLVDDRFFSQGRLPKRKLRALLAASPAVGTR